MKVLADGKRVVTGSPDQTISIFDISSSSKKPMVNVKEHGYKIFSVDVSKNENLMVSAGSGSTCADRCPFLLAIGDVKKS